MKRPSFQFYPGDWTSNPNLRRCTFAERGIWLTVMCLMHDQDDEYGLLRWPLKEIAEAVGCRVAELQSLIRKGVLKGNDARLEEPFIYVPRSGRKNGDPVVLIDVQEGPIWYSSRMVKDEYVRTLRGESGTKGATPKPSPKPPIGEAKGTPKGPRVSSSSSSPSVKTPVDTGERTPSSPAGTGTSATLSLVPPDFRPDEAGIHKAAQAGIGQERLEIEISKFVDHYCALGETRADWQAQWRKWCLNSTNFAPRTGPPASADRSSTSAWWADETATNAKARELGLSARPGETMTEFRGRIRAEIEHRDRGDQQEDAA